MPTRAASDVHLVALWHHDKNPHSQRAYSGKRSVLPLRLTQRINCPLLVLKDRYAPQNREQEGDVPS